jgi:hypothetical protein
MITETIQPRIPKKPSYEGLEIIPKNKYNGEK